MDKRKKFLQCFVGVLVVIFVLPTLGKKIPIVDSLVGKIWATDDNFKYEIREEAVYITGYEGKNSVVEIPKEIDNKEVKVVAENAFKENSVIKKVSIPDTVTTIEDKAFSSCTALVQVNIPESVLNIGDEAFFNCTSLTSVNLPSMLNCIGANAFSSTGIKSISIPDTVVNMGAYVFANCYALEKVDLSGGITKIEDNAFCGCTELSQVNFSGSIASIGSMAFSNCKAIKSLKIPTSVTEIGQYAFEDCTALESLDLPDTITEIDKYAFSGCKALSKIHIPKNVNTIKEGTFLDCETLASLSIPTNVLKIEKSAFSSCSNLNNLEIPSNVKSIEESAFLSCKGLKSLVIEDGVSKIGSSAFMNCEGLVSATIGKSVREIDNMAFYKCESLKKVLFLGNVPNRVGDNAFENISSNAVIIVPNGCQRDYENILSSGVNLTDGVGIVEGSSSENNNYTTDDSSATGDAQELQKDSSEENKDKDLGENAENNQKSNEKTGCTVKYLSEHGTEISKLSVDYNSTITLLEEPNSEKSEIFVGWSTRKNGKNILCMPSSEYTIDEDVEFKEVWIDLYMLDGASIRLNTSTGIRFSSRVGAENYNNLKKCANNVEFGTIICPTSTADEVTTFSSKKLSAMGKKFLDITVNNWFDENESYKEFTGVITDVKKCNYQKDFSARSYVNITYWDGMECRFYSKYDREKNSRSIYQVANSALKDASSYSSNQIELLKEFVNISNTN